MANSSIISMCFIEVVDAEPGEVYHHEIASIISVLEMVKRGRAYHVCR